MASNVSELPAELIGIIGELLSVDDLLNLCKSSPIMARICQNSQFWRNMIWRSNPSANLENLSLKQLIALYKSMGYIYVFGENVDGQLGLPGVPIQNRPVKISPKMEVIQVSCGYKHTAIVTSDNKILVVGDNTGGQLGLGDRNIRTIPTFIPNFDNVRQVSCGGSFTAFITLNGELYTFGSNFRGQLGSPNRQGDIPRKVATLIHQKIVQISCGTVHMVAVNEQGNVYGWGSNNYGQLGLGDSDAETQPTPIKLGKKIKYVACGLHFTIFLTDDGEVYGCGDGTQGQLGLGNVGRIDYPQKIPNLPSIHQVAVGRRHSLFLTTTGEVYVCGDNSNDQLGLGETQEKFILTPIKNNFLPPIKQVSGGHTHSAFISTQGKIYICGDNHYGVLGLGLTDQQVKIPTPIPNLTHVIYVACGNEYTALINLD